MKFGIYGLVLYLSSERGEMEEKKWDCEFSSNPPIITFVRSFFSFSRIFFEYFKLSLLKIFSTSHVMRKFTLSFSSGSRYDMQLELICDKQNYGFIVNTFAFSATLTELTL